MRRDRKEKHLPAPFQRSAADRGRGQHPCRRAIWLMTCRCLLKSTSARCTGGGAMAWPSPSRRIMADQPFSILRLALFGWLFRPSCRLVQIDSYIAGSHYRGRRPQTRWCFVWPPNRWRPEFHPEPGRAQRPIMVFCLCPDRSAAAGPVFDTVHGRLCSSPRPLHCPCGACRHLCGVVASQAGRRARAHPADFGRRAASARCWPTLVAAVRTSRASRSSGSQSSSRLLAVPIVIQVDLNAGIAYGIICSSVCRTMSPAPRP